MSEQTKNVTIAFRITEQEAQEIEKATFIDGTIHQKAYYLIKRALEISRKFPYLCTPEEVKPEDAGFPPCDYVKPFYWNNEFIGFHCLLKNPPLDLPKYRVGNITIKACKSDICWTCVELYKKLKTGIGILPNLPLEIIAERKKQLLQIKKEEIRLRGKPGKPPINRELAFKLFALGKSKKEIKQLLMCSQRTYWRLQKEWENLPAEDKDKIKKSVIGFSEEDIKKAIDLHFASWRFVKNNKS
jgi:hypothetical protein